MTNPYADLPEDRFWRRAVADRAPLEIEALWTPKYPVRLGEKIVTAGSCFAQHIGRALAARGYDWFDAEPAPAGLPREDWSRFHYGTFSFRTGNIYTPNMLAQWLEWAFERREPPQSTWRQGGRYFDPYRPAVEPGGFETEAELFASRAVTLAAIARAAREADVFVFTLGLTESWRYGSDGAEFAICPGTVAGRFRPRFHRFVNHGYEETLARMRDALAILREVNPQLRVLLTVSPVPLTATASGKHVLVATTYSKAVLRAVAGQLAAEADWIDYFPSYEIITGAPFRAMFYEDNLRSVRPEGVGFVMDSFFRDQERVFGARRRKRRPAGTAAARAEAEAAAAAEATAAAATEAEAPEEDAAESEADIRCEEEMLDAFSR